MQLKQVLKQESQDTQDDEETTQGYSSTDKNIFHRAIDPLHDDDKNQNKSGALCIVGFIGGPLSDNTVIIPPF